MYQIYPANEHIERFTDVYLTDEQFQEMEKILRYMPYIRPYWGNTKYRYIIINHIYFLYDIDDENNLVIVLGVKFNNARKRFNFAETPTQINTLNKWIQNKVNGLF